MGKQQQKQKIKSVHACEYRKMLCSIVAEEIILCTSPIPYFGKEVIRTYCSACQERCYSESLVLLQDFDRCVTCLAKVLPLDLGAERTRASQTSSAEKKALLTPDQTPTLPGPPNTRS